jgi:anti-anti-sigma regulatory factor
MDAGLTPRPVRELRPGDLAWLAFADEEEQGHIIGSFIGAGLAGADTVVYVTDAAPRELPGVADGAGGTDAAALTAYAAAGRLRLIPWRRATRPDGHFDAKLMLAALQAEIARAASAGARGVRVTAEMSWAVRDAGVDRILECERRFGAAVAASTMVTAICQVDRRNVTAAELAALRGAHEVAARPNPEFEDPMLRITRTFHPRGLAIAGELDAARHPAFAAALAAAPGAGEIHLDCAELRFMDLGALNVLAGYARGRGEEGQLVLDRVPGELRAVIELVGWGRLPGVRLGDVVP